MSPKRSGRCPRCGRPAPLDHPSFPFCSKRCRLIDLGKWFNEEYQVEKEERDWKEGSGD
ncbi:MAG: DNA gyrase inhibitor YacG [Acidobacteriota bacterium]